MKLLKSQLCLDAACLDTLCNIKPFVTLNRCLLMHALRVYIVLPIYCNPHLHSNRYMTKEELQSRCMCFYEKVFSSIITFYCGGIMIDVDATFASALFAFIAPCILRYRGGVCLTFFVEVTGGQ